MKHFYSNTKPVCDESDFDYQARIIDKERMLSQLAFQNRKLMVYDGIDDSSIFRCIYSLLRIRDADKKIGTKEPIEIMINSLGGSVYDGLSLISLIENMKDDGYEIITTNMGYALSMGFIISIVGSKRRCYRYATYMHHDISSANYGKLTSMEEEVENMRILRSRADSIVLKYTNLTKDVLDDINDRKLDKYFTAEEALKLNICDEVI